MAFTSKLFLERLLLFISLTSLTFGKLPATEPQPMCLSESAKDLSAAFWGQGELGALFTSRFAAVAAHPFKGGRERCTRGGTKDEYGQYGECGVVLEILRHD
jgi:hypothetical protein